MRLTNPPDDVRMLAEEFLRPVNVGNVSPRTNLTLGEFVETVYFVNKQNENRASTMRGYKQRWNSLLAPRCRNERLREFDTPKAQRVLKQASSQPLLKDPTRTQTKSTVDHLKTFLSGVFRHAIQQGFHPGPNPIRETTVPRAREGEETYAYSLNEELAMLKVLPEPARTMVALASFGGLRRSEIFGVDWKDYTGAQISVEQTVVEGIVEGPKTRASKGKVPVIAPLQTLLDAHRMRCGNPTAGPIFATLDGKKALRPNNVVNRMILPALSVCVCGKRADEHVDADHEYERDMSLPEWRGWHPFRRGLGTNLHDLGVHIKTISKILRHKNSAITANLYVKTLDAQQIGAMHQLEVLVQGCLALPQGA